MSGLDLTRYETVIRRCVATLLHASYTDGIPTETTDTWRTIAADASRDLTALITRLRAAEARAAWADSLALQAHTMATAIDQADEDGGLDSLGPVTAAIIRSDVARMLEIVAERPAAPEALRLAENALAALGAENDWVNGHEAAILAALDAADAQGYARAMGDAADRAMAVASSYGPKPASGYAEGAQDALHSLADDLDGTAKLARERLPAAAERD